MLRDFSEFACEGRFMVDTSLPGWSHGVLFGSGARSRSLQFGLCKLLSPCCTEHLDLKTRDRRSIDIFHLMQRSASRSYKHQKRPAGSLSPTSNARLLSEMRKIALLCSSSFPISAFSAFPLWSNSSVRAAFCSTDRYRRRPALSQHRRGLSMLGYCGEGSDCEVP